MESIIKSGERIEANLLNKITRKIFNKMFLPIFNKFVFNKNVNLNDSVYHHILVKLIKD